MFNTSVTWLRQEIHSLRRDRLHRKALLKSVEEVVEITDPIIRLAHRYRKALLPSVETTIHYCKQLVNSIPGPISLNRKSYHDTPLVKALFRSVEEMESLLHVAGNTVAPSGKQELFALLTMAKTETVIFGHKQQGEMILADVPMKAVTFVDHHIVAPTPDLHTTKSQLEQRSLEIIASVAMEKISSLKANLAELRARRDRLSSMHRIIAGKRQTFELFAQPDQQNAEKIRELKALLIETKKEIESARKELETPEDTLGHLQRIMDSPSETLALRELSLRLNWMNVIIDEREETPFHKINLAELSLNEELRRLAILVFFNREMIT